MAIKTYTESGPGRKKCPACPHYVPAVTKKCQCGHQFVKGTKPKPQGQKVAAKLATTTEPVVSDKLYPRNRSGKSIQRTVIPSGACAKLTDTDQATVYAWIEKVLKAKEDVRTQLEASALKYYARYFYSIVGSTEDYETVCQHIDSYWETPVTEDAKEDEEDVKEEDEEEEADFEFN